MGLTTPGSAGVEDDPAPEVVPAGGAAPACVLIKLAKPAGFAPIIYAVPRKQRVKSVHGGCGRSWEQCSKWKKTHLADLVAPLDHDERGHRSDSIPLSDGLQAIHVDFLLPHTQNSGSGQRVGEVRKEDERD